jgi:hypothetical protein
MKRKLSDLPLKSCKPKKKRIRPHLTSLILQILLGVLTIYLAIVKKQFAFIAISSGVLPSLIFMYQNLKKVQEEIKNVFNNVQKFRISRIPIYWISLFIDFGVVSESIFYKMLGINILHFASFPIF